MTGKRGKPHHAGNYARQASAVRAAANANANTVCWRDGLTLDQHPAHKNGRRPWWTAGHVVDGQVGGELRPEASVCASRTGAERGNRLREPRSEDPYT